MNILLVKVTLMPVVIGLVTLVSRRWGNKAGGLIASMPWIAGPILLFLILEHGKNFGIQAVPGILTGILSLIGFCYCYARLAPYLAGLWALLLSYLVFVLIALLFTAINLDLLTSYGIVMVSVVLALRFFPTPAVTSPAVRRLPYDVPIRMIVATLFVIGITGLAALLGPTWSGILTPFPIITSILAVFTQHIQGSSAAIVTLRGIVMGLLGFTTFLFLQAFLLPEFSVAQSFFLALLINGAINLVVSKVA
ncbi:hypothetical protein [uncultured Fibrella sp.]|uniref:hypothetical protein n=1 Tax=uncultured Fibrella sp. TaxID=1284596 RepID=UPI0035CA3306